jgi:cytochrome o ubiquinol oxidase subunit 2
VRAQYKAGFFVLYIVAAVFLLYLLAHGHTWAVLDPKGVIAQKQRDLMVIATGLMLIVVLPVFVLTALIAWRYRASNTKAGYTPDFDHHTGLEFVWWALPFAIIMILSVIAWQSSHQLDPYKPLNASAKPLTIEVVALQWKWLFIYPAQHIATVNYLQIPENTPISFNITADAPMNSFWVPQLGGQVYAMAGMSTQLHLMASGTGTYTGVSANLSGNGFADMHFKVKSTSKTDFDQWVGLVQQSRNQLGFAAYNTLAKPGSQNSVLYYSNAEPELYDDIVMKFMMPMPMPTTDRHKATPTPTPGVSGVKR